MFQQLTDRLSSVVKNLTGQGRLTEKNIEDTLRDIRIALLEADTALPVAKAFIEQVKAKALGQTVIASITPGQALIKLVYEELVTLMGEKNETLTLKTVPPAVILVAGLQGAGKTTTVAKLAYWLKHQQHKTVLVTSVDVYRPAALDQLAILAKQAGVDYVTTTQTTPVDMVKQAIQTAKNKVADVLLIDTAGRLHVDEAMMTEIKLVHQAASPIETLFVVDSMTGQDAANTAKAFHEALPLTGVILTKTDGDAKGGAALSTRYLTGAPIKWMGVGEKIEALEPFYPDRLASRILGMGDIVSLVEEAEQKLDQAKTEKLMKKIKKGQGFDLEDFREQLQQLQQMGGISQMMGKLPGFNAMKQRLPEQLDNRTCKQMEAIIGSMTVKERRFPDHIRFSQKTRIAKGSGTSIQAVNQLLKQFHHIQKMMKKMKHGGMAKFMRMLGG